MKPFFKGKRIIRGNQFEQSLCSIAAVTATIAHHLNQICILFSDAGLENINTLLNHTDTGMRHDQLIAIYNTKRTLFTRPISRVEPNTPIFIWGIRNP